MMKRYILATMLSFTLLGGALASYAQDDTPTPETPATVEVTAVVETPPDVVVVVEQPTPTEPAPTSTVQSFLFTGAVFAGLAVLTFVFWQQGKNLKVVAGTVPPEIAQLIFRVGMGQVAATEELYDDEALKTLATALGYDVVPDGRGGYTITAAASVVAENQAISKEVSK